MSPVHVFFDFDDTLLDGDSILYWMRFYYARRPRRRFFLLANWIGLALFAVRLIRGHALKRIFLWPMAYEKREALDALASEFVRADLARRFHRPVLRRLWAHHLLGHKIWVVSASATFYLKHLKALLPMAEIEGTEMTWPDKGLLRFPRYRYGNLRGANKIARLNALGFGDEPPYSFAYSDHHHDEFLLRFSEFPCCVRPTRRLRKLAEQEGWPILDWPRERTLWKVRLEKFRMLVWPSAKRGAPAGDPLDPAREGGEAAAYADGETQTLRDRVASKYPEDRQPEAHRRVFARSA